MLGKGYDLAKTHPQTWQRLLEHMLPTQKVNPLKLVVDLSRRGIKVKEQAVLFEKKTSLKVRSFYKYRKEAGL
jgi:NOL1/NOP2/fmu family ribosome biogenesis protein